MSQNHLSESSALPQSVVAWKISESGEISGSRWDYDAAAHDEQIAAALAPFGVGEDSVGAGSGSHYDGFAKVPTSLLAAEKVLVVTDVDSTLIEQEVIEMLASHAGKEAEVAAVTEAAMRGELDFAQSLRERVATLAGLPESIIAEVVERVEFTPGAFQLAQALHLQNNKLVAVSGGFNQVLAPLAEKIGLDAFAANELEIVDGHLTGRVVGEIVDRAAKARYVKQWAEEFGVPLSATIAVGDGANDIDMLETAGIGVAFCAKPALEAVASVVVRQRRLDILPLLWGI
ncbi:phosphoserine phosphatase [Neomicrococcus aestuarii]|uniref:phosphoserine phosphatase n=1 Tax=Neomicrococcus aestuarii TaxID=556325 RepID=A0A7W8TUL2_9MICC|nr:phosphoserine phosphatase SerB [Neomicrococcus aestuarii]MBB5511846.1 phosphoserine phosphatase [Neomicrococcus aestuarii]